MNCKLAGALVLLAAQVLAAQVSIGIVIGTPPPPPRMVYVRPACPGPEFYWVEGYWYPVGNHYRWHDGYWARPPYAEAVWVGPCWREGRFYDGYWDGRRGRVAHHQDWDRDRDWDGDRERGHGNGRGNGHHKHDDR